MLHSFMEYCVANPQQRFWQALRNWTMTKVDRNVGFIYFGYGSSFDEIETKDTFYLPDEIIENNESRN